MTTKNQFLDLIEKQRNKKSKKKFKGTFLEYLELLQNDPSILKLAHKRLHDVIHEKGVKTVDVGDEEYRSYFNGEKIRKYQYFHEEFFGMEPVIHKLMQFLKSAALKGEESRQVLLLMEWVLENLH